MQEPFLSTSWYRVADLRPRLRGQGRIHRHRYRGQAWYVLADPVSGRTHRFTPAAYLFLGRLDGHRTVDSIWRELAEGLDEDAPSQEDVVRLLSQLHQADLLQHRVTPDVAELLERYEKQSRQVLRQNLTNPLSFRLPLLDPDAFLTRTLPLVRPFLGGFGLLLWFAVVAYGGAMALLHWPELTHNVDDRLLALDNLLLLALTYPVVKALHELGHGYLAKVRGAEVREMGIMLLVFFPVPYVDASASAAFRSKWQRAAVGAGGILVELFLAALAAILWVNMEPGFARAVAFNVMLIGGVSTLLFNGNPLLRFDGYYVLTDLIEIPNLGNRSNRYLGHLVERYVFGAERLPPVVATPGERVWFVFYAPFAYVYRLVIMLTIALFVASHLFVIGVLIALWSITTTLVWPLAKGVRHVLTSPRLRRVRTRAVASTGAVVGTLAILLAAVPAPLHTTAEGVVWLPETAHVRAKTSGFVVEVAVPSGTEVAAGEALVALADPALDTNLATLTARIDELVADLAEAQVGDRVRADLVRLELLDARARVQREADRAADLVVRAPVAGRVEFRAPTADLEDRFVAEGELVALVVPPRADRARVVVAQADIALVRNRLHGVELVAVDRLGEVHPTAVASMVPAAVSRLPSPALGVAGGGRVLTDPSDGEGLATMERVFQLDVWLPEGLEAPFESRVLVRFAHDWEPLGYQVYRRMRQLFLGVFGA